MSTRTVPVTVAVVFLLYLAAPVARQAIGPGHDLDVAGFGRLPVVVNGRVQPFDTVARVALSQISGRDTVPPEGRSETGLASVSLDATRWLLEVISAPDIADTRRIFPAASPDLLLKLSLGRPGETAPKAVAFRDVASKVRQVTAETQRVAKKKDADRAPWERELIGLQAKLVLYERLKNSVQPNSALQRDAKGGPVTFDFAGTLAGFRRDLVEVVRVAEVRKGGGTKTLDPATEQRVREVAARFQSVASLGLIAMVPPAPHSAARGRWQNTGSAIVAAAKGEDMVTSVRLVAAMMTAFARGDSPAFNKAVELQRQALISNGYVAPVRRAAFEVLYNVVQPPARAAALYAIGLILLLAGRLGVRTYGSAPVVVILGVAVQAAGLAAAIVLSGRPSFLGFAGWVILACALALESAWRTRTALATGTAIALAALTVNYSFVPGGAGIFLRHVLDLALLGPVAATSLVIGFAAYWAGRNRTARPARGHAATSSGTPIPVA